MQDGGRRRNKPAGRLSKPPVTKYYRSEPKTASPFQKKTPVKSLSAVVSKTIDILLIIILLFCLVYSLIVRPDPKVIASSSIYHEESAYQTAAASDLGSFKDRNKLSFDEVGLVDNLKKHFPEISKANVELPLFGQKPIIRLTIAAPVFIFVSQGHNFLISSDGVVVSENPDLPAAVNLPRVEDKSGFKAQLGEQVLGASQVEFINQVVLQCRRAKVSISSLTLPSAAQELDLRTKDASYFVKFYLGGDPLVETGQFLASRAKFARDHIQPTSYLDVRVAGKIFYK